MKKILALILAAVLCLGIVAACGGGGNDPANTPAPTPQPDPPTPPPVVDDVHDDYPRWTLSGADQFEISIAQITNQTAPSPDNRLSARLKDELGVTMVYELVASDQQDERVGILLAGDTLPDILGFTQQECRLTEGGAKLRLDDHLATGVYPNIYDHVEPFWGRLIWRGGGVENGLYTLPNYNRFYPAADGTYLFGNDNWWMGFWFQKDVLAWHDYPDIKHLTAEQSFQLIIDYMEAHPEGLNGAPWIGFTIPMLAQPWALGNSPNFLAGNPNDGGVVVDPATGEAKIYATMDFAKDWFKLLNEMYHKGVLDPEFHTMSQDSWFEKMSAGRVLGLHHQRWSWGTPNDALVDAGMYERTMVPTAPVNPGKTPYYLDVPVMNVNQGWSVSIMAEHPERILTFIENILSEYWQIIIQWGEEEIDYHIDADGNFYRTEEKREEWTDLMFQQNNRLMALMDQMPKIMGNYPVNGNPTDPGISPIEWQLSLREYDREFLAAYNMDSWRSFMYETQPENPPWFPAWQAPLGDGTAADKANTQMEEWQLEFLPQVIMAPDGEFEDMWAQYVAHFDRIDVAAYEAAITEFTQRLMAEAAMP